MMQAAVDAGYTAFGQPAVFTDRNLDDHDCVVVISHDLAKWGDAVTIGSDQAMINVRRGEASRPRRGETFTLESGVIYRVDQVLMATEYEYMVIAVEDDS